MLVPPEIAVLDVTASLGGTHIAAALAELGIADAVGDRSMTAHQVCQQTGTDVHTTHRLLRAAVHYGLCTMDRRTGAVKLTRTGKVLSSDHRVTLREWATYMARMSTVEAWAGLTSSIKDGSSSFSAVHGMSVWDWFSRHPEDGQLFAAAMRQATRINSSVIAGAYPWPEGGTVCDVAGGIGTLIADIVEASSGRLRGVLVDAPGVITEAATYLEERGLSHRITCVVGDVFADLHVGADVYVLKDVLHDWDDGQCRKILDTVASTMPRGSRIVLVEMVQEPNRLNALAPFIDLQMLTQTDGGRQRSLHELESLLTGAGLRPTGKVRSASPHDLVEAVKP